LEPLEKQFGFCTVQKLRKNMKPKMGFKQKPKTTPFCIEIKHKTGQCDRKFETKNGCQKTVPKIYQVLVFFILPEPCRQYLSQSGLADQVIFEMSTITRSFIIQ
jgi:hypothetical protein